MCSVLLFIGSHVVSEEKEIEIKESVEGDNILMNNNELINQLIKNGVANKMADAFFFLYSSIYKSRATEKDQFKQRNTIPTSPSSLQKIF